MSAYDRAVGGALKLKGVGPLIAKKESKKKKKEKRDAEATAAAAAEAEGGEAVGIGGDVGSKPNKSYEELFPSEVKKLAEAKGRTSAWGSNFRAAPEVLHGYSAPLAAGARRTAEERLDLRAASKADKHCK